MSGTRTICALWIVLDIVLISPAHPDILLGDRTDTSLTLTVSGTITDNDSKIFENAVKNLGDRQLSVGLDSLGGDVFAAMQIGRSIRLHQGFTFIPVSNKCYSSCALIFISGVMRHDLGELGLHRPYFASAPQDRRTIEARLPQMLAQIKQYVAEMGIGENFYQQMMNIDPSKMAIYTIDNYTNLIPERDPVFDEIQVAYDARRYGVTTLEMRQRDRDAEECLQKKTTAGVITCQEAVRWGLSERAYSEQSAKAKACKLSDDDLRVLEALPRRQVRDHPLILKQESCERAIMLDR